MKQQLRIGSNPIKLQGTSFGRAYLLVQGVTTNTTIGSNAFDLQNLRTQIEISQCGVKDTTSFNAVGPVARAISELGFEQMAAGLNWNISNGSTTLAGFNTGQYNTSAFYIPLLEGGYILKGDDYINFNIDILPSFMSADVSAGSSVYLVTEEANGIIQADVNLPVYEPITTDKQSPSYTYDALSEVSFVSFNNVGAGFDYNSSPLQSVDFRSDYVTENFDIVTLYAKNVATLSNPSNQSFPIFYVEPSALWNCQVGLAINTSNVNIGLQFLYVRKVLTSPNLVSRAVAQETKIQKSSLRKRGLRA